MAGKKKKSKILRRTLNPEFGESFSFKLDQPIKVAPRLLCYSKAHTIWFSSGNSQSINKLGNHPPRRSCVCCLSNCAALHSAKRVAFLHYVWSVHVCSPCFIFGVETNKPGTRSTKFGNSRALRMVCPKTCVPSSTI